MPLTSVQFNLIYKNSKRYCAIKTVCASVTTLTINLKHKLIFKKRNPAYNNSEVINNSINNLMKIPIGVTQKFLSLIISILYLYALIKSIKPIGLYSIET